MNEKPNQHGLSIVGPFILIGLGVVLLLQQLGMIQWSLWEVAFRLWPLIIIAVGADILIARRSYLGAVCALLAVLALLAGGIYLMGTGTSATGGRLTSEEIAYEMGDAVAGDISLSMDAGQMTIGGLPDDSRNVIAGTVRQAPGEEVTGTHNVSGTQISVVFQSRWPQHYFFTPEIDHTWDLALTGRIPLEVDIALGAGEIVADLSGLKVTSVDVKLGAGQLILTLPSGMDIDVNISIGAGDAEIHLPEGAAVTIDCTTGVGNCSLPNGSGFWGQEYTSAGYSESEDQIRIEVNVGVGEAEIIR
jgi:hypothetical protein